MTLKTHSLHLLHAALAAALLAGCASSGGHAPVRERGAAEKKWVEPPVAAATRKTAPREKDWRPQVYVVQKGDTLYSIAFNHGLDYHEIADLNGIQNPGMIKVGQEIRLFPDNAVAAVKPVPETRPVVMEAPIKSLPRAAKLPYSEQAVAELEKMQEAPH
ncbi:MAG: LysM peptidoglycan-binding domain-containing protein, partial [Betaproteobacteria bacterium]|nr:LysM peptidoglycan-binding domain-containing protein [Betaproteobacteria bacterium]